MVSPRTDNGEMMSRGLDRIRKPMEEVRAWKLTNGTVFTTKLEAVIAVLAGKSADEWRQTLSPRDTSGYYAEIAEAVCWLADEIRKRRKRK